MAKRNQHVAARRRNPAPMAINTREVSKACEQCRLSGRSIRVRLSLNEAQEIVDALGAGSLLGEYLAAHLTIAKRPDSYEYDR